jgi:hypothetical protein
MLLNDAGVRLRMGETNRAEAAARFGLESAAERFVEAVLPLIGRP